MKLLLPMDREDTQEGALVPVNEAAVWAVVELEEGQVTEVAFYGEPWKTSRRKWMSAPGW